MNDSMQFDVHSVKMSPREAAEASQGSSVEETLRADRLREPGHLKKGPQNASKMPQKLFKSYEKP